MTKTYKPTKSLLIKDKVYRTKINDLYYLEHNFNPDDRGFFAEIGHTYKIEQLINKPFKIAQINHAFSKKNVVRGLHLEDWNKLVTVIDGLSFAALADLRPESKTFGQVETFILGPKPPGLKGSLFITAGIGNSVCVLKGPVDYIYCVDKLYKDRKTINDQAVSLFDPDLNIDWPIKKSQMIISKRDQNAITLRQKFPQKFS